MAGSRCRWAMTAVHCSEAHAAIILTCCSVLSTLTSGISSSSRNIIIALKWSPSENQIIYGGRERERRGLRSRHVVNISVCSSLIIKLQLVCLMSGSKWCVATLVMMNVMWGRVWSGLGFNYLSVGGSQATRGRIVQNKPHYHTTEL